MGVRPNRGQIATEGTGASQRGEVARDRATEPVNIPVERLIESDLLGIVVADLERVIEANDAFLRMVGYSRDDLRRGLVRWPEMTPAEYEPVDQQAIEEARLYGSSQPFEKEYVRKDGRRVPILAGITELAPGAQIYVCFILDLTERRRAETERAQFLALLDTIMSSSPVGMAFVDRDLRYVRINDALAAYNGLTPEEHQGKTVREVLKEAADLIEPQLRYVLETGQPLNAIELTAPQPNAPGTIRHWLASRYPVRGPDGEILGVGIAATDITQWKAIEAERERLLAQLQAVLKQMPAGVIIAEAPSGRLVLGNEQVSQIWRRPFFEAAAVAQYDAYPGFTPDGRRLLAEEWPLARSISTGEVVVGEEIDIERGDGTWGTILVSSSPIRDGSGAIVAGVVTFTDITDRKLADRERTSLLVREQLARADAERERERAARLQAVTASLAEALTQRDVARIAIEQGIAALGAVAGALGVPSASGDSLELLDSIGYEPEVVERLRSLPRSAALPAIDVWRTGKPIWIANRDEFAARYPQAVWAAGVGEGFVTLPLTIGDRVIGVLGMRFAAAVEFAEDDTAFIRSLVQQCAQALERAQLYEAEQRARLAAERAQERTARLQTVTSALSEALTQREVAAVVLEQGVAALNAIAAGLLLAAPDGNALVVLMATGYRPDLVAEGMRVPLDTAIASTQVFRTGQPAWFRSRAEIEERFPGAARVVEGGEAFAAIPLIVQDRVIGVLNLGFGTIAEFEPADRAFILALAQQCAQALERARLYEAERAARAEAETAVQLRERFLSIAAHELKTPLTTIKGYGQILQRQLSLPQPKPERLAAAAEQVLIQANRLETLIADLLDVSRVQQGRLDLRRVECDLVAIAREVLTRHQDALDLNDRHQFVLDAPEALTGHWDPARLDQVLTNLISNAIKYSPDGGEIRVTVRRDGSQAVISVSDQGVGIPAQEQRDLFQPFMRGEAVRGRIGGAGLGLYISAQIVQQHQGTLAVASQPGKGSTFTIRLPLAP